jgi:signal transduction histidine kinase
MVRRVIVDEVMRLRLVRMYQDARAAIDAREEVLRIVSHDLRNPLSTIAMAVEVLREAPGIGEEDVRHLEIVRRAGERMNRLVHDLLDAARIEAGRLPIEAREIGVVDILDAVAELMGPLASDRSLSLVVAADEGLPPVRVDPDRINQVFSNLIGNAIKFTPPGGQVTLRAERMGDKVRFAVVDTGPGIPAEQLKEIFGRMWQASRDDTRGIGLGLTIAKAIVEAHGERIGVESRVGEGTEFWFTAAVASLPRPIHLPNGGVGLPAGPPAGAASRS